MRESYVCGMWNDLIHMDLDLLHCKQSPHEFSVTRLLKFHKSPNGEKSRLKAPRAPNKFDT